MCVSVCVCAIEFAVREYKINVEVVSIIRYLRRHVVITIFEYSCLLFQTNKHVFARASGSRDELAGTQRAKAMSSEKKQ